MSFKGANEKAIIISPHTESYDWMKVEEHNHKDGTITHSYNITDAKKANQFIVNNEDRSVAYNHIAFFEAISNEGHAFLLTTSFTKNIKNSARNVGLDEEERFNEKQNSISFRQMVKKVCKTGDLD